MSAETDLIALLRTSSALLAVVRGIFLNAADEATSLPYLVITATHSPELTLTGEVDIDHVTFTIAAWGNGASMAEHAADLAHAVIDADDDYAVLARTGGFDDKTATDAAVLTADRWV